ncbi:cyclin-domain-containing protein [Lipomyces kononenkoae]|uniref:Cyclin-domain-containing protein n=1 Tax=Lipomyces kononenkoae TaxID=34357 RepID=A0ACC3TAY9_LIPKO
MSATMLVERYRQAPTSHPATEPSPQPVGPLSSFPSIHLSSTPPSMADLAPSEALRLLTSGIRRILALSDPASMTWQPAPTLVSSPSSSSPTLWPTPAAFSPPLTAQDLLESKEGVSPSPMMSGLAPSMQQLSPGSEHHPAISCDQQQQQQQQQQAASPSSPCPDAVDPQRQQQQLVVDKANQRSIISRRFWSKSTPGIDIEKYLQRIHQYCPISTAVYLATSLYIYRLCIVNQVIPLTPLNVHRLVIAALRVASKSLEDINHLQKRFAKVGGLSEQELCRLEIGFLFLMDFDLKIEVDVLEQQAGILMALEKCC